MRTLYLTGALCLCALLLSKREAAAQNSNVSIGTGSIKSNAILWLKANGNQGFLLPVVADHDNFTGLNNSDDKGMVVFDSSDGKVYYWDGSAWVGVGAGASAANQLLTLAGNTLSLTGAPGSNVNISTSAPTAGQALVWNGTAWTAVSLAGDVSGAQGTTTVGGLKGRAIPTLPATANALVYDGSAWVFQPITSSGEANTASNVGTSGAGVFKQKTGVNLEFNKLNAGSNRVSVVADPANSEVDIDVIQANLSLAATQITGLGPLATVASVGSAQITDGSITGADLSGTTITADKLAQSGATTNQVLQWNGTNWVPATASGSGTVTSVTTGTGLTGGPITSAGTIGIAAGGVTVTELAANAVTSAKIADATITGPDIAATTITADKLAQSGATANQVLQWNGTNWVPGTTTGSGTVTSVATGAGLTGGPITGTGTIAIAAGGVGTAELAANAVNAAKIADATVTGSDIAAATITGSNIAATTITDANIANTTITAGKLAQSGAAANQVLQWNGTNWVPANAGAGTVTSVATGTGLTGGPISATGTISIAAGGVGTTELAANAVNAAKIADGTVTGADIAATTITGANIANTTIGAGKLAQSGAVTKDVLKWNGTTWAPATDSSGTDVTTQTGVLIGDGTAITGSTAGPGVRGILGSTNNVVGWVNGAANQFLGTDGAGVLQFQDKSSLVFSTANEIPRGNGTTLVSSNMFSTGTNIGIGTSTPRSVLEIQNGNLILSGSVGQPLDPVDIDFKTFDDVFKAKIWTDPASNTLWMSTSIAPASNKYFTLDENGNFGFSNTNPTAKVDIIGTFKLADGSQGVNEVLTSDANGLASWQAVGARANNNTAIGASALAVNTGALNTAMGSNALPANTTGNRNTAFGYGSLFVATTATDNVAVGYNALDATTIGSGNVGIGVRAGDTGTVGMENVSGNNNTFIGILTGPSTVTPINNSTAIGANATVSQSNSLILGGTGGSAVNVGIGTSSPDYLLQLATNGNSTISLASEGGLSDIIMGADALPVQGIIRYDNGTDRLQFGTSATIRGTFSTAGLGIARIAAANALEVEGNASNTTASAWLANSDRRIKTDIRDIDNSFELIKSLRPVKFKYTEEWKRKHPSIKDQYYYNFIAQEYQQVFPESVKPSGEFIDGDPQEVLQLDTYNAQIAAIKAVQEMILKIEELEKENAKLKAESEKLKSESAKLTSEKRELESRLGSVEDKQQAMLEDLEALKQLLGTTSKE